MNNLSLTDNKKVIAAQDNTKVIKELMKIIGDVGCIPEVIYDNEKDCTRLEFEGTYNNFNLYLYVK